MDSSDFVYYKNAWIKKNKLTLSEKIEKTEARSLMKDRGWYVRNIYQWDLGEQTSFWYVIKDQFGGIEELPSKVRNQVRKSLKTYEIKKVSYEVMLEVGCDLFNKSRERFEGSDQITQDQWKLKISDVKMDFWLGYDIESGNPASFAIATKFDDYVDYTTMGINPVFPNSTYPMYGLIFEMNRYYLDECHVPFICDGARSITEHSSFQPFLEDKFKFRKAYCKLQVIYEPILGLLVKLLYPFRKLIKNAKVAAVLYQESMVRG